MQKLSSTLAERSRVRACNHGQWSGKPSGCILGFDHSQPTCRV